MSVETEIEPGQDAVDRMSGTSILQRAATRRLDRDLGGGWHDVPSWGGELQAYYRVLEKEDVEEMVRRARARSVAKKGAKGNAAGQRTKQEGANDADLDFIIKACVNVKAVDVISEEEQDLGLTYENIDAWKEQLHNPNPETEEEIEAERRLQSVKHPREMVAYLMGYNSISIASHAGALANWMQDTSKETPQ